MYTLGYKEYLPSDHNNLFPLSEYPAGWKMNEILRTKNVLDNPPIAVPCYNPTKRATGIIMFDVRSGRNVIEDANQIIIT